MYPFLYILYIKIIWKITHNLSFYLSLSLTRPPNIFIDLNLDINMNIEEKYIYINFYKVEFYKRKIILTHKFFDLRDKHKWEERHN